VIEIRPFEAPDSEQASYVITRCLKEINSRDYTEGQIQKICDAFTPKNILKRFSERKSFVAVQYEQVIGTATLKGQEIGSMFVNPDFQGCGIGKLLIKHIEDVAKKSNVTQLKAYSSIAAIEFYKHLGYHEIKEKVEPDGEITIEIEKTLV